jgi:hypothetical protein
MNEDEEIKLSEKEWDEFYENQGSHFLKLEGQTLEAHGADQKKLLYEIFGSSKTLVQTIGVVAGFGFTGLAYVKELPLFIIGEFFMLGAIFAGLLWTQTTYRTNLNSSLNQTAGLKKLFADRFSFFKKIYDKAMMDIAAGKEISISKSQMVELQKQNNQLLEKFTSESDKSGVSFSDPFGWLMLFFAIGGSFLLISFVNPCFFKILGL